MWGIAMPPRNLPEPTGPFAVGSVVYDISDPDRAESYAPIRGDTPGPRTIRLQLWYPTDEQRNTRRMLRWIPEGRRQIRAIVNTHGFPGFIWNHTGFMAANSIEGAHPAISPEGERFPVIIISHGWEGYRGLHVDVAEELASHGYLVAAADHSYGAAAVVLEDGRIIQSGDDILPLRENSPDFPRLSSRLVQTFADDNRFILDHLMDIQAGSEPGGLQHRISLAGKLDLSRIGLLGHSTGGGAMVRLAIDYRRELEAAGEQSTDYPSIQALVGLDAWVEPVGRPDLESGEYELPSLFLRSAQWEGGINDGYLMPFVSALESPVELYQIENITHQQFTTLYMYAPVVQWLGMIGSVKPQVFMEYQRQQIRAYFDHRLKAKDYRVPDYEDLRVIISDFE